uniref:Uncharacterized protein n=1 Tax=Dunaliella tertiolecta TaxID=3047 RepID=A0A7S3QLX7_DUNTE
MRACTRHGLVMSRTLHLSSHAGELFCPSVHLLQRDCSMMVDFQEHKCTDITLPPCTPCFCAEQPRLPVFLYCAEVAKTNDAILQLGLEQHVEVVDDLKQAQAVLSVKIGRGGRLNNLQQVW